MQEDERGSQLMPDNLTSFLLSLSLVVFAMPVSLIIFMVLLDLYERWQAGRRRPRQVSQEVPPPEPAIPVDDPSVLL